jgi:hypothetical protein
MGRLLDFSRSAVTALGGQWTVKTEDVFEAYLNGSDPVRLTSIRDRALREDGLALLGLEQPFIRALLDKTQSLPASERALLAADGPTRNAAMTIWAVTIHGKSGQVKQSIVRLALTPDGARVAALEALPLERFNPPPTTSTAAVDRQGLESMLTTHAPQALHRDLEHRGSLSEGAWYSSRLLGVLLLPA